MPDHVSHPERYRVYTLDEPVWVGGFAGAVEPHDPWHAARQVGSFSLGAGSRSQLELTADHCRRL